MVSLLTVITLSKTEIASRTSEISWIKTVIDMASLNEIRQHPHPLLRASPVSYLRLQTKESIRDEHRNASSAQFVQDERMIEKRAELNWPQCRLGIPYGCPSSSWTVDVVITEIFLGECCIATRITCAPSP